VPLASPCSTSGRPTIAWTALRGLSEESGFWKMICAARRCDSGAAPAMPIVPALGVDEADQHAAERGLAAAALAHEAQHFSRRIPSSETPSTARTLGGSNLSGKPPDQSSRMPSKRPPSWNVLLRSLHVHQRTALFPARRHAAAARLRPRASARRPARGAPAAHAVREYLRLALASLLHEAAARMEMQPDGGCAQVREAPGIGTRRCRRCATRGSEASSPLVYGWRGWRSNELGRAPVPPRGRRRARRRRRRMRATTPRLCVM
jgi:hypothetical protein